MKDRRRRLRKSGRWGRSGRPRLSLAAVVLLAGVVLLALPRPAAAVDTCSPYLGGNYYCCDGSALWRCTDGGAYSSRDCAAQGETCNYRPSSGQMDCSTEPLGTYPTQQSLYACDIVACTASCAGKTCGPDGCGGSCGSCGTQEYCTTAGKCEFTPLTCAQIFSVSPSSTCCSGNLLFRCMGSGEVRFQDCAPRVCNVDDWWDTQTPDMGCVSDTSHTDPYFACPPLACTGNCTGRECGFDGCASSCGTCAAGQDCTTDGKCVGTILSASNIGPKGCCSSNTVGWYYDDNFVPRSFDCMKTGGGYCAWRADGQRMGCQGTPPGPEQEYIACPGATCTPLCEGRSCGPNGCGGLCGSCLSGQSCNGSGQCVQAPCTSWCPYGTQCGDDGCGGSCGTCQSGETCDGGQCYGAAGSCGAMATNASCCDGRRVFFCGSDGRLQDYDCAKFGGYCFNKGGASTTMGCTSAPSAGDNLGKVACSWACQPQCTDKTCGPDGCGDVCGICFPGQDCGTDGVCKTCQPNCINKQCGDNGCGGSCGTCGEGLTCDPTYRRCVLGEGSCGSLTPDESCCAGTHLRFCLTNGRLSDLDCAPGATCGSKSGGMGCTTSAAIDASYRYCPGACTTDCDGKNCGPDGCNGSCGSCGAGDFCNAEQVCECRGNCFGVECGDDGCGRSCGTCAVNEGCAFGQCVCEPQCEAGRCGGPDGCGGTCLGCASGQVCGEDRYCRWPCRPDCTGMACGDNGCGGSCGTCAAGKVCDQGKCYDETSDPGPCVPKCDGRVCGGDGCGGSCGTCQYGECLSWSGQCYCSPRCTRAICEGNQCAYADKLCGDDGCGGTCGTACPADKACHPTLFRCVCAPQCEGKQCGDNGCGGHCGTGPMMDGCPRGYSCNAGQCECTPYCPANSCGPDGCGGTCGGCPDGKYCLFDVTGKGTCQCKRNCEGKPCYAADGCGGWCAACAQGTYCSETTGKCECIPRCGIPYRNCGNDGCGGTCGTCRPGQVCNALQICECVPNCVGKSCGPDGCGGACGNCDLVGNPQVTCDARGQCACRPNCSGKECGDDGCGGSCGTCADDKMCAYRQGYTFCVCKPQCAGKACGPDGCGGVCGQCPPSLCTASGQCLCQRNCTGKECGPDGCGGSCGWCGGGAYVCEEGTGKCVSCTPNCAGRQCGFDGCNDSCGFCPAGKSCGSDGKCYRTECGNLTDKGCCTNDGIARICGATGALGKDCLERGQFCGWDAANSRYDCIASSNPRAPSNSPPRECPGWPACTPKCTGRTCGDDGCGGTCGTCGAEEMCDFVSGKCKPDPCGGLPAGGCCEQENGVMTNRLFRCKSRTEWENVNCGLRRAAGDGYQTQKCGWSSTEEKVTCVEPTMPADAAHPAMCPAAKCIPHCNPSDECGPDGCGGSCGKGCQSGWRCVENGDYANKCVSPCSCEGKKCGSNGCGGSCGSCTAPLTCNESVGACVPVDPCRGLPAGETCCEGQQRVLCSAPIDKGKHLQYLPCGYQWSGGYGAYCGWDDSLQFPSYQCVHNNGREAPASANSPRLCPWAGPCQPSCGGKQCGPDGCGGFCGNCPGAGESCNVFGQCEAPCNDGTPTGGCCIDNADPRRVAHKQCLRPGGGAADVLIERCGAGKCGWGRADALHMGNICGGEDSDPTGDLPRACPPPPICKPQCTKADGSRKECGDDGCGGVCGSCAEPRACDTNFKCTAPAACGGVKWQGSCTGETLRYCAESAATTDSFLVTEDCGPAAGYCGWDAEVGAYRCGTSGGKDPAGAFPSDNSCRRCEGKTCGPDGCGGACGSPCGSTSQCVDGQCIAIGFGGPSCFNACGRYLAGLSCQCDGACIDRGDCCASYESYCAPRQLSGSRCGRNGCETKGGENCATCPGDCGACQATSHWPPWNAPYAQIVAMAGTPAQHAEALVNPLDRVLPAPPPYPLEGLLAYVPRAGVSAGPPTALVLSDKIGSAGAPADVVGAQGTGIGFAVRNGTSSPNYGVVRVFPDAALPRKASFQDGQNGGFSLAFWARVPANAPDVPNPLVGLRTAIDTTGDTVKMLCARPRPRDGRIEIQCPKILGTQLNVLQVRAYYGSVGAGSSASCASFEAMGASANCGSTEIQAIAEAACVGKPGCSFNPTRAMRANSCTEAPFNVNQGVAIVQAFCGSNEPADGPALMVEPASGGNKLSLRVPGAKMPLVTNVAFKDDKWRHVALTFQPYPGQAAGGLTTIYVDGQPEETSGQYTIRPFSEVLLGAARQGSLDNAGARPSNYRSGSLAAIADLDELFVYDRALAENEIRSLLEKKEQRLLRVWPAMPPERIVRTGAGISGGAAEVANVEAPWLRDPGTGGAFKDPRPALGLPADVNYATGTVDGDLSGVTSFTFAGWIRVPALTAIESETQTLMRLVLGSTEQVALVASSVCGGDGGLGARVNGEDLKPLGAASCLHNLKAGEWAFVAYVQDGATRRLMVDGFVASTYTKPAFTLFGARSDTSPRRFEAGDGVQLFWAGLYDRALSGEELEVARSQGPAVWFDDYISCDRASPSCSRPIMRDWANFHHNREWDEIDAPRLWKKDGTAAAAVTGNSGRGLTLKAAADGLLNQITIPASGRGFRAPTGSGGGRLKVFSWAGRVRVPAVLSATGAVQKRSLPLVTLEAARVSGTGTTPAFKAWLVCDNASTGSTEANAYCHVEVTALRASASAASWSSETAALVVPAAKDPFDVDVTISYDGSESAAYLGTLGGQGKSVPFAAPRSASIADSTVAPPVPAPFFRMAAESDELTLQNIRFYPRLLSPVEMKKLTTYNCEGAACGARGRSCVAGAANAVLECGGCASGFEGASAPGGQCFPPIPFLSECVNDVQCATGLCAADSSGIRKCAARTVDATCSTACARLGRDCVASAGSATCSTTCSTFYEARVVDGQASCVWSPVKDDYEACYGHKECKSGACIEAVEWPYAAWTASSRTSYHHSPCDDYGPRLHASTRSGKNFADPGFNLQEGGLYSGYYCPPWVNTRVGSGWGKVTRCAGVTDDVCKENHQLSTRAYSDFRGGDAYRCTTECSPETFEGRPLWVQAYRTLSPDACKDMVVRMINRGSEGRGSFLAMDAEPTLLTLKQLMLDKDGVVTPKEWSQLQKLGVGENLLAFATAPESEKQKLRDRFGRFKLNDCMLLGGTYEVALPQSQWRTVTDPGNGQTTQIRTRTVTSPFHDLEFNARTCAANKFPDGTVCPPPNAGDNPKDPRGDQFCESGFCGRDTATCSTGFGRLEEPTAADRGDATKEPEGGDFGPVKLVQTNKTTMEVRKTKDTGLSGAAAQKEYTLMATNKQGLSFFGSAPANLIDIEMTMHMEMDADEGDFDSKVFIFDIQMPGGQSPASSCEGVTFQNGEYKEPEKPCAIPADKAELVPDVPQVSICLPAPGGCEADEKKPPVTPTKTTERGPLCWKQTTLVGPVPITIQAEVTIDACIGVGAEVDSETKEPAFMVTPSLGVGVDLRGGVGGSYGPVEVFAGVHAAITIVEIAFPIKWGIRIAAINKDHKGNNISNFWDVQFFRGVSAELTVLKLLISLFAEAGVWIFKVSWDYIIFQFGGLTFVWDLDEHVISSVKLDLEHPTANQ